MAFVFRSSKNLEERLKAQNNMYPLNNPDINNVPEITKKYFSQNNNIKSMAPFGVKALKESSYHRTSVGPKFIKKRDLNSKFDSIYESSFIRNKNLSKTRESSKNDNKLNQTTIIEPKNLKLEKKEIKVKTGIKKNLPINNNNNIKSTSQLKTSLIELKKELKEKEELNQNLQNKIK